MSNEVVSIYQNTKSYIESVGGRNKYITQRTAGNSHLTAGNGNPGIYRNVSAKLRLPSAAKKLIEFANLSAAGEDTSSPGRFIPWIK